MPERSYRQLAPKYGVSGIRDAYHVYIWPLISILYREAMLYGKSAAAALVLEFDGAINYDQKSELSEMLARALGSDASLVVVDLSKATFLDGFGVGLIRTFNRWLRSDERRLVIVAPQPYVQGVLSLAGIAAVVRIEVSLEHAIAHERDRARASA